MMTDYIAIGILSPDQCCCCPNDGCTNDVQYRIYQTSEYSAMTTILETRKQDIFDEIYLDRQDYHILANVVNLLILALWRMIDDIVEKV